METAQTKPRSFCIICDAAEGECEHHGRRYLEPIEYQQIEPGNPFGGLKVPDHERERWNQAPLRVATPDRPPVVEEARDVEDLILDLSAVMFLEPPLEAQFRTIHKLEPLRLSRLTNATIEGAAKGTLHNPAGFLRSRLAQLVAHQK